MDSNLCSRNASRFIILQSSAIGWCDSGLACSFSKVKDANRGSLYAVRTIRTARVRTQESTRLIRSDSSHLRTVHQCRRAALGIAPIPPMEGGPRGYPASPCRPTAILSASELRVFPSRLSCVWQGRNNSPGQHLVQQRASEGNASALPDTLIGQIPPAIVNQSPRAGESPRAGARGCAFHMLHAADSRDPLAGALHRNSLIAVIISIGKIQRIEPCNPRPE